MCFLWFTPWGPVTVNYRRGGSAIPSRASMLKKQISPRAFGWLVESDHSSGNGFYFSKCYTREVSHSGHLSPSSAQHLPFPLQGGTPPDTGGSSSSSAPTSIHPWLWAGTDHAEPSLTASPPHTHTHSILSCLLPSFPQLRARRSSRQKIGLLGSHIQCPRWKQVSKQIIY